MKYLLLAILFNSVIHSFSQVKPGRNDANSQAIDSLKRVLLTVDEKKRSEVLISLFREYLPIDQDTAFFYANESLQHAKRIGDSVDIVIATNAKGNIRENKGDTKEAIKHFEYALGIAQRNNYKNQVKYLLNNLANINAAIASYDKALRYNFESLKIREEEGNPESVSIALNNIGFTYGELGDYENALVYYEKAYQVKVKNNVRWGFELCLASMANTLVELGNVTLAESKIKEVLAICDTSKCRPDILIITYQVFGRILFIQNKYQQAENYFKQALELSQNHKSSLYSFSNSGNRANNLYWLASIKFREEKIEEAINYLNRSADIAQKGNFKKTTLENYLLYTNIYTYRKDYIKALDFQTRYNKLSTEILNGDLLNKISRIRTDFEERENTARIAAQAKMMGLQQESLQQQRLLNICLGIVALLTIGLVVVLFKISRQRLKANKMLDQRVRERTSELEKNRDELKHSHDEQATVLRKVTSDLNSSLATMKGLSISATKDLPEEQTIYLREAEATTERLVNYVSKYSDTREE